MNLLNLDGWCAAVDFRRLKYGDSFFIPSVNWTHDRSRISDAAEEVGCEIAIKGVIENEIMGLRVWCTRQADFD